MLSKDAQAGKQKKAKKTKKSAEDFPGRILAQEEESSLAESKSDIEVDITGDEEEEVEEQPAKAKRPKGRPSKKGSGAKVKGKEAAISVAERHAAETLAKMPGSSGMNGASESRKNGSHGAGPSKAASISGSLNSGRLSGQKRKAAGSKKLPKSRMVLSNDNEDSEAEIETKRSGAPNPSQRSQKMASAKTTEKAVGSPTKSPGKAGGRATAVVSPTAQRSSGRVSQPAAPVPPPAAPTGDTTESSDDEEEEMVRSPRRTEPVRSTSAMAAKAALASSDEDEADEAKVPSPRGRGRAPKSQPAGKALEEASEEEEEEEEAAPRRSGLPPKLVDAEASEAEESEEEDAEGNADERSEESAEGSAEEEAVAPKRRGRPPKARKKAPEPAKKAGGRPTRRRSTVNAQVTLSSGSSEEEESEEDSVEEDRKMPSQRRAPLTSLPNKKKKAKRLAPGATANLKKAKKGENNAESIAEGAYRTATRTTRSRAPGKGAEGSTPKPEAATKAGKGAAGSGKPKATKEEAENDKLVPVYCGEGKLKVLGTYDVDTTTVICKKASLGTVQPEAFCYMAGLRTKDWMKNILIQGDGEGRNLADWLNQSCEHCKSPGHEDKMLICDNDACQKHWHIFCLRPKLVVLPGEEEQWFCPECVAK